MLYKLLSRIRKLGAAEYWRARCLKAEDALEAERERNREREDMFVSAAVMGSRGMFGVAPRTASRPSTPKPPPLAAADPWQALSFADRQEFQMYWWPDAEAAGVSEAQAKQRFLLEIAKRKTLNDGVM